MQPRNIQKIQAFKNRFHQVLSYIAEDTPQTKRVLDDIVALPDAATDGFHDAYLTAKLITITLMHFNEQYFKQSQPDNLQKIMFKILFDTSIEEQMEESLDNIFASCDETKEPLTDCLEATFRDMDVLLEKDFFQELQLLKKTCFAYIEFYDIHKNDIQLSINGMTDTLVIQDTYLGLEPVNELKDAVFLTEQGAKKLFENNKTFVINEMMPCLGVLVFSENEKQELSCYAQHVSASDYSTPQGHISLFHTINENINILRQNGFTHNIRTFMTGGSIESFALSLNLIMQQWEVGKASPLFMQDIYLLPSPQGSFSHCIVELSNNRCLITVGGELHESDRSLAQAKGFDVIEDIFDDASDISMSSRAEEDSQSESEENSQADLILDVEEDDDDLILQRDDLHPERLFSRKRSAPPQALSHEPPQKKHRG